MELFISISVRDLIIVELGMQANDVTLDVTLMARDEIARRQRTGKLRRRTALVGAQVDEHGTNARESR